MPWLPYLVTSHPRLRKRIRLCSPLCTCFSPEYHNVNCSYDIFYSVQCFFPFFSIKYFTSLVHPSCSSESVQLSKNSSWLSLQIMHIQRHDDLKTEHKPLSTTTYSLYHSPAAPDVNGEVSYGDYTFVRSVPCLRTAAAWCTLPALWLSSPIFLAEVRCVWERETFVFHRVPLGEWTITPWPATGWKIQFYACLMQDTSCNSIAAVRFFVVDIPLDFLQDSEIFFCCSFFFS